MDVVFSSAVIEHIGSLQQQKQMLRECLRVARKGVFITTPNRWHPMEAHTLIPLLHWLPKSMHRRILRILGLNFYAREENLNLVDKKTLSLICNELRIKQFSIKSLSTFKIVSNLMLIIKK
jgi:2-polyprenyl-3-methyl-5-hydroxy-6-metoxy-1,4-benzoquinol methylase